MEGNHSIVAQRVVFPGAHGNELVADQWAPDNIRGTVLLLHGGGQTRHSWAKAAMRLANDGWRALAVDARGHGESDWVDDYRLDGFVADLRSVTETLGVRPAIVGASLGGRTALTAEGEGPSICSALVLLDIAAEINRNEQGRVQDFLASAPHGFATLEEASEAIDAYRGSSSRRRNLRGLEKNLRLRDNGRWYWHWDPRFLAFGRDPNNSDSERLYRAASQVSVPTLLVRGTRSDMVSPASAAELVRRMPVAELIEVDAGHMITGGDNAVFTRWLAGFLDKHLVSTTDRYFDQRESKRSHTERNPGF